MIEQSASPHTRGVKGDLLEPCLGLSKEDAKSLADVTLMIHCASTTDFEDAAHDDHIDRMNIGGFEHFTQLVDNVRDMGGRPKVMYVSTAYQCGLHPGPIPEGKLFVSQHRNKYEWTKWWCDNAAQDLGFYVVRPSILIGHSKTYDSMGQQRMIYGWAGAQSLAMLMWFHMQGIEKPEFWQRWQELAHIDSWPVLPLRLKADRTTTQNTVCIDDAATVMDAIRNEIMEDPPGVSRVYNLVSPWPLGTDFIVDSIQSVFKCKGIQYCPGLDLECIPRENKAERMLNKITEVYRPYVLNKEPEFEMENVRALVPDEERPQITPILFMGLMLNYFKPEMLRYVTDNEKLRPESILRQMGRRKRDTQQLICHAR
jgi:nucleoside-diphosphate-sugar epimerase